MAAAPWSQGPMVLEALNILAGLDLRGMGHNSAAYIHAVTEALKLAAADREVYFGDPDFVDVPLDVLLSDDYAARRRARIDPAKAWPGMPPAGEVGGVSIPPWRPDPSAGAPLEIADTRPETSFLCVADSAWQRVRRHAERSDDQRPGGAGNRDHRLDVGLARLHRRPTIPARIGPGRRPRMSANPAIAIKPGELVMPFGSPGSEVLGQAMVQVFLNQAVFGMDPQSACEAPRFRQLLVAGIGAAAFLPARPSVRRGGRRFGDLRGAGGAWPSRRTVAGTEVSRRFGLHHPVRPADRREVGGRRSAAHGLRHRVVAL